jgi:hypothetical protein
MAAIRFPPAHGIFLHGALGLRAFLFVESAPEFVECDILKLADVFARDAEFFPTSSRVLSL